MAVAVGTLVLNIEPSHTYLNYGGGQTGRQGKIDECNSSEFFFTVMSGSSVGHSAVVLELYFWWPMGVTFLYFRYFDRKVNTSTLIQPWLYIQNDNTMSWIPNLRVLGIEIIKTILKLLLYGTIFYSQVKNMHFEVLWSTSLSLCLLYDRSFSPKDYYQVMI